MKAHKFLASLPEAVNVLSPSPSWTLTVYRVWIWFHSCTISLEKGNEESRVLLVAGTSRSLKELFWEHLFCCFKIPEYGTGNCWVTVKTILNCISVQWEANENSIPTDDLQCTSSTRNAERRMRWMFSVKKGLSMELVPGRVPVRPEKGETYCGFSEQQNKAHLREHVRLMIAQWSVNFFHAITKMLHK